MNAARESGVAEGVHSIQKPAPAAPLVYTETV